MNHNQFYRIRNALKHNSNGFLNKYFNSIYEVEKAREMFMAYINHEEYSTMNQNVAGFLSLHGVPVEQAGNVFKLRYKI